MARSVVSAMLHTNSPPPNRHIFSVFANSSDVGVHGIIFAVPETAAIMQVESNT